MHRLLRDQLALFFGGQPPPDTLAPFIEAINSAYKQFDADHTLEIAHLANYDEITGLMSRNLLNDRLQHAITIAHRNRQKVAVVALDVDHFKLINESMGHATGDKILKITADRIRSNTRESDTTARFGGDEIVLVLPESSPTLPDAHPSGHTYEAQVLELLQRIIAAVREPILINDTQLSITCSIGVSFYPQDGDHAGRLLQNADAAMSIAKQQGRDNVQFFSEEHSLNVKKRLAVRTALSAALEREEFVVYYQPQVDLRTGLVAGVEALVRWQHPDQGLVGPDQFIEIAEESGLIIPLGEWVLRTACIQCKRWQKSGFRDFRMAVNLSARQFSQPNLIQLVQNTLEETQLDAKYLELELTESMVMTNVEQSVQILEQLKTLGVKISVDDFGTGYSSLSYLRRFPIDVLKVDQSFVRNLDDPDDAIIASTIISMAHRLGMNVIAEGVETEAQCEFLRLNLCDEIQGYLFSKAIPEDDMLELLRNHTTLPEHLLLPYERTPTLLLVDDEAGILNALTRLLRREKYRILTAQSGEEGLALLEQHEVDVIVSDQRMPGMTGAEFFRRVKNKSPDIVRIILSGYAELESIIQAVNEGDIYQFLTKPWDDEHLIEHIAEAFRRKNQADKHHRALMELQATSQQLVRENKALKQKLNHVHRTG